MRKVSIFQKRHKLPYRKHPIGEFTRKLKKAHFPHFWLIIGVKILGIFLPFDLFKLNLLINS
nr:MAG TPA: hypothetical protein [Caudoviricetes sp.]